MNYYKKHLGDYAKDTGHLSALEHGVYNLLLDYYYSTEMPIPEGRCERIAKAMRDFEKDAVRAVLDEFFYLEDGCYHHAKCDEVIAQAQQKSLKAQASAEARWGKNKRNANASETHSEGNAIHNSTTTPPSKARTSKRSRKAPRDFVVTDSMRMWAVTEHINVNLDNETAKFMDHDFDKPKSDWVGTWRNWIRRANEDGGKSNGTRKRTAQSAVERNLEATRRVASTLN